MDCVRVLNRREDPDPKEVITEPDPCEPKNVQIRGRDTGTYKAVDRSSLRSLFTLNF
jgi:hypothetical protein